MKAAAPALLILAIAAPIAAVLFRVDYLMITPEFIAYRIGDALSVMAGEAYHVRPVQGLPTALVSALIVRVLYAIYGAAITTPQVIQIYCAAFFALIIGGLTLVIWVTWPQLPAARHIGICVLALLPWYGFGPRIGLMVAPDYWIGEYAYLIASVPVFAAVSRKALLQPYLLGVWVGLGVAIKITMFPLGLVLIAVYPAMDGRAALKMIAGGVAVYIGLAFVYLAGSAVDAFGLLAEQMRFFALPNTSKEYAGLVSAMLANPGPALLGSAAIVCSLLTVRRSRTLAASALIWIAIDLYLIKVRPHGTSLTSVSIGFLFLIAILPSTKEVVAVGAAIVASSLFLPLNATILRFWIESPPLSSPKPPEIEEADIVYVPTGDWNDGAPLPLFGYNGQLALRCEYGSAENGKLAYARPLADGIRPPMRASDSGKPMAAQLTWPDVREIRRLHSEGLSSYALARRFGMSRGHHEHREGSDFAQVGLPRRSRPCRLTAAGRGPGRSQAQNEESSMARRTHEPTLGARGSGSHYDDVPTSPPALPRSGSPPLSQENPCK